MPTLLSSKTVTARKPHRCGSCSTVAVQPGDTYTRESYVYDGRAYTWVSCADCAALMPEVWDWAGMPDEGVGPDEYAEWALDHRDDPTHGEAARAFLIRTGSEVPA